MWNSDSRWTGDYSAAGVTDVEFWVRNPGATALNLRIGFGGNGTDGAVPGGGDYFSSDTVHVVAAGAGWTKLTYSLSDTFNIHSTYSDPGGAGTLADTLSSVFRFIVVNSAAPPTLTGSGTPHFRGDVVVADAEFNDITVLGVPEPGSTMLVGLAGAALLFRRRRA